MKFQLFPSLMSSKQTKKSSADEGSSITIIYAKWIAPCKDDTDDPQIIHNGAVAIKDKKILAIGSVEDVEKEANKHSESIEKVELSEYHILIPGLINTHTHLAMSLLRGYCNDVDLDTFLTKYVWPAEDAIMSEQFVYHGSLMASSEALYSGTTTMNDSYFLPESTRKAFKQSGLRVVNSELLLDSGKNDMDQQFAKVEKYINEHYENNLHLDGQFQISLNAHSCYTVSEEWLKKLADLQKKMKEKYPEHPLVCHIHVNETIKEKEFCENKNGKTAINTLADAGLLNEHLLIAHCVHTDAEETKKLADAKVSIAHCPKSNMKLASGFAPIVKYLEAGINVSIGTDGACSNNSVDMLAEMRDVCLIHKSIQMDPTVLNAYTVLKMATRNGAKALGRLHQLGSLEPNKYADIVAIDLSGFAKTNLPVFDPIAQLLYTTQPQVTDVWVNGKRLMSQRKILTFTLDVAATQPMVSKLNKMRALADKKYFEEKKSKAVTGSEEEAKITNTEDDGTTTKIPDQNKTTDTSNKENAVNA